MSQSAITAGHNYPAQLNGSGRTAAFERRKPGHLDRIAREREQSDEGSKLSSQGAKTILFFATGMLTFSLVLYYSASFFGDGLSRVGYSQSTNPIEIIVGNSALEVPSNVVRFQKQRAPGSYKRLELFLHWPTLSGYHDLLRTSFSQTGDQADLVFLSLEPRTMSLDMSGRMEPIYSRYFSGNPTKGPAGLVRQPLSTEGGFIDEDLYYDTNNPYPFAARCVRPKSTVSTPFCIRDIHIGKDLMLTYRFHVRHLPDWLKIDERIRLYANSLLMNL